MMGLQGFDISHFQTISDDALGKVIASGHYAFGGLKESEGTYQTDPTFHSRRQVFRAHGFPRRVYHEMTHEGLPDQLRRIMAATGGELYPRERLMIVLGDFGVTAPNALAFLEVLAEWGPTKHARSESGEPATRWRPLPIVYANRSLWNSVYTSAKFDRYPKEVAAYPGDGSEFHVRPNVVFHQYGGGTNPDPATRGDRVEAHPGWSSVDLMTFFRR